MEKLALTCKILYDKDYLDRILLSEKTKFSPIVKYDDYHVLMKMILKFQNNLKKFLKNQLENEMIYQQVIKNMDFFQNQNIFIVNLKEFLKKELLIFTNNKYKYYIINVVNNLISSLVGSVKGLYYYDNIRPIEVNRFKLINFMNTIIITSLGPFGNMKGVFDDFIYIKCNKNNSYYSFIEYRQNHLVRLP